MEIKLGNVKELAIEYQNQAELKRPRVTKLQSQVGFPLKLYTLNEAERIFILS